MQVIFYGVRGSIPAPGPETVRYGGNTPCVAVRSAAGDLLILDSGTGISWLGRSMIEGEFGRGQGCAAILLSHAHWDHIQGFPFFPPVFVPGNRFTVFGPARSSAMLEGILEGQMNPNFSPLYTMKNLGAVFELVPVEGEGEDGPLRFGSVSITCRQNPHGHTTCLAYRLEEDGKSVVYAPDAGYPAEGPGPETIALYAGADMLIHDATYTPEDRRSRLGRGYSSWKEAADAALLAGVKRLALFHYDQDYTDDQVDEMVARCQAYVDARAKTAGAQLAVLGARETLCLEI
jgi:phosphoribosyl 1,2-cyclic phosphodiesterase